MPTSHENRLPSIVLQIWKNNRPVSKLAFDCDLIRIGRDPRSEVVLADKSISRMHARLLRDGGRYRMVDNGSSNGTLVNDQVCDERQLETGDFIQVGPYRLWVEVLDHKRPAHAERDDFNDPTLRLA